MVYSSYEHLNLTEKQILKKCSILKVLFLNIQVLAKFSTNAQALSQGTMALKLYSFLR